MVETSPVSSDEAAQARAKILEGVDFIETEEDVEAVESAVVKIQSTFRGKKIRSKLGQKAAPATLIAAAEAPAASESNKEGEQIKKSSSNQDQGRATKEEELHKKVASMQVNDSDTSSSVKQATAEGGPEVAGKAKNAEPQAGKQVAQNVAENEADRAAAKIQAGFKGYKTRKELEGKLNMGAGQQMASQAGGNGANSDQ